jgi:hypothetical protein
MNKETLISKCVEHFKKGYLNRNSRWFRSDVEDYTKEIKKLSIKQLNENLNRWNALHDPNSEFNQFNKRYKNKLLKAGMFNMGNMKPVNCLD